QLFLHPPRLQSQRVVQVERLRPERVAVDVLGLVIANELEPRTWRGSQAASRWYHQWRSGGREALVGAARLGRRSRLSDDVLTLQLTRRAAAGSGARRPPDAATGGGGASPRTSPRPRRSRG